MAVQSCTAIESELETRLRIVTNAFKARNNCIVLRLDTAVNGEKGVNPFGFHFEFDKVKYEENKERKKRAEVTRWLAFAAYVNHKLGIRHVLLIVVMSLYAILGGFMFEALEAEHEIQSVAEATTKMSGVIAQFVTLVVNVSLTQDNEGERTNNLTIEAMRFYKQMLLTEDRYMGSAWHKAEDLELNIQWTVLPAMFYAFTVFSTVGYGSMACRTGLGRAISIIYGCIGIPLMLLTIGDLGEVLQRMLCRLLGWLERLWCCCCKSKRRNEEDVEKNVEEDDESVEEKSEVLPMWTAISIFGVYMCIVSVYLYIGDMFDEQQTDFKMSTAFYFAFVSMTTIGFGDVMPNSIQYFPLTALAFLFGFVLISIINTSVYSKLYDHFYSAVMSIEERLEAVHADNYETSGHKLFKKLSPVFTTLSLSFPSSAFAATKNKNNNNKIYYPSTIYSIPVHCRRSNSEGSMETIVVEIADQRPSNVFLRGTSEEIKQRAHSMFSTSDIIDKPNRPIDSTVTSPQKINQVVGGAED